jgi:hypothetical protein
MNVGHSAAWVPFLFRTKRLPQAYEEQSDALRVLNDNGGGAVRKRERYSVGEARSLRFESACFGIREGRAESLAQKV